MRKYYRYEINLLIGNILCFVLIVFACVPVSRMLIIFFENISELITFKLFLFYLLWMFFHEVLHGIGYSVSGVKMNELTYGAKIEKGILFCLVRKEIRKRAILISLVFPFFFIGVFTYVLGILINNPILVILSIFNIGGSSIDLIMICNFIKLDNDITYIEPGDGTSFYLMSNNLKVKNLFGLKLVEEGKYTESLFKDIKYKRVDISKKGWSFLIIYIILLLVILIF